MPAGFDSQCLAVVFQCSSDITTCQTGAAQVVTGLGKFRLQRHCPAKGALSQRGLALCLQGDPFII